MCDDSGTIYQRTRLPSHERKHQRQRPTAPTGRSGASWAQTAAWRRCEGAGPAAGCATARRIPPTTAASSVCSRHITARGWRSAPHPAICWCACKAAPARQLSADRCSDRSLCCERWSTAIRTAACVSAVWRWHCRASITVSTAESAASTRSSDSQHQSGRRQTVDVLVARTVTASYGRVRHAVRSCRIVPNACACMIHLRFSGLDPACMIHSSTASHAATPQLSGGKMCRIAGSPSPVRRKKDDSFGGSAPRALPGARALPALQRPPPGASKALPGVAAGKASQSGGITPALPPVPVGIAVPAARAVSLTRPAALPSVAAVEKAAAGEAGGQLPAVQHAAAPPPAAAPAATARKSLDSQRRTAAGMPGGLRSAAASAGAKPAPVRPTSRLASQAGAVRPPGAAPQRPTQERTPDAAAGAVRPGTAGSSTDQPASVAAQSGVLRRPLPPLQRTASAASAASAGSATGLTPVARPAAVKLPASRAASAVSSVAGSAAVSAASSLAGTPRSGAASPAAAAAHYMQRPFGQVGSSTAVAAQGTAAQPNTLKRAPANTVKAAAVPDKAPVASASQDGRTQQPAPATVAASRPQQQEAAPDEDLLPQLAQRQHETALGSPRGSTGTVRAWSPDRSPYDWPVF